MNIGELSWPDPVGAAMRVRHMQRKLHHWAVSDADRRFDDVFNHMHHPDFLTVEWERVRGNRGARTAGVDRVSPAWIAVPRAVRILGAPATTVPVILLCHVVSLLQPASPPAHGSPCKRGTVKVTASRVRRRRVTRRRSGSRGR